MPFSEKKFDKGKGLVEINLGDRLSLNLDRKYFGQKNLAKK